MSNRRRLAPIRSRREEQEDDWEELTEAERLGVISRYGIAAVPYSYRESYREIADWFRSRTRPRS